MDPELKLKIIKKAPDLDYKKRMTILRFLIDSNVKVSTHSDGSRVNLDTLSSESLEELSKLVDSFKISQQDLI